MCEWGSCKLKHGWSRRQFNLRAVPLYILIDKHGIIIIMNANAEPPYSDVLKNQLKNLVDT